jgi:hypothetical protein
MSVFIKMALSIFSLLFIVACGGGSEGNKSAPNGDDMLAGSECVDIPWPKVGMSYTARSTIVAGGVSQVVEAKHTYTKVSKTSISEATETKGAGIVIQGTSVSTFTVNGDYMDITKRVDTNDILGGDVTTSTYDPYERNPLNKACKGQKWTNNFVSTSVSTIGGTEIEEIITSHIVESINESKTVEAGTFVTYKVKMTLADDSYINFWFDTKKAVLVSAEAYAADGGQISTTELIALN